MGEEGASLLRLIENDLPSKNRSSYDVSLGARKGGSSQESTYGGSDRQQALLPLNCAIYADDSQKRGCCCLVLH